MGLHMNLPIHLPGIEYTDADFDRAFDETLGTERMFAYDHFGSQADDVILSRMRYMIGHCGVEVLALDHISIVVSGGDIEDDERRRLDKLMTDLRSLMEETRASLHLVSHLRRPAGAASHEEGRAVSLAHLRGTQAIAQLSDTVIAGERDQQAVDARQRNTTQLRVLKNRYAGITGPADQLYYEPETGRLRPLAMDMIPQEGNNARDF